MLADNLEEQLPSTTYTISIKVNDKTIEVTREGSIQQPLLTYILFGELLNIYKALPNAVAQTEDTE